MVNNSPITSIKILGVICFSQRLFPVLSKEKNSLYFSLEYILYLKTKLVQKKEEKKLFFIRRFI